MRLCQHGGKINVPPEIRDRGQDFAEETELEEQELFEAFFKLEPDAPLNQCVSGIELTRILQRISLNRVDTRIRQFRVYLETRHGVKKHRLCTGRVFKGLVFKDGETAKSYRTEQI